jgi:hypothetical protein
MRFAFYVFSLPPPTLRRRIFIIRQRIRQADAMGEIALGGDSAEDHRAGAGSFA